MHDKKAVVNHQTVPEKYPDRFKLLEDSVEREIGILGCDRREKRQSTVNSDRNELLDPDWILLNGKEKIYQAKEQIATGDDDPDHFKI